MQTQPARPETPNRRSFPEWPLFLLIVAVGAALRLWALGQLPPGLYQDEAFNGLDALGVIAGDRPLFFPANNGREPLYIYLVALSVAALGREPLAVRLPAALIGLALVPATYALARALFDRRVALLSMAVVAVTFWPVALSRIGFRAGALPLLEALALASAAAGWRRRRPGLVALGGLFYGLSFYTYLAVRFTPLALFAFLIFWYIAHRPTFPTARWLAAFGAPAAVVVAPLAVLAGRQPDIVLGRAGQVSILSPAVNGGDLWGTLFHNVLAALGMFVWRGDDIARHNLPGRPVFDALLAAAWLAGLLILLQRLRRRDLPAALTLAWLGVMLLPTILAEDAPHFLRAVGVLPFACLLPGLGLDALWGWLERRARPRVRSMAGASVCAAVLAVSLGLTGRDYFGRYARDPDTGYLFQSAATELARSANAAMRAGRRVYVDRRLWDSFASLRFAAVPGEQLVIFDESSPPAPQVNGAVFVWPYDGVRPVLMEISPGVRVTPGRGPLARDDLEPEPYSLYSVYWLDAFRPAGPPAARFEGGLVLVATDRSATPGQVSLTWTAESAPGRDYQVYAGALVDGGLAAQADGPLGMGLYPSSWWRAGEVVRETRRFDLPPGVNWNAVTLQIGLYDPATGERIPLRDGLGDYLEISP